MLKKILLCLCACSDKNEEIKNAEIESTEEVLTKKAYDLDEISFILDEDSMIQKSIPETLESYGYVENDKETWNGIGEFYGCV